MAKNDFHEPDWLIKARAEGMIISETRVGGGGFVPSPHPSANMVPKSTSGHTATRKPKPSKSAERPASTRAFTVEIAPLRLASEANTGGSFRHFLGRKKAIKAAISEVFDGVLVSVRLPVVVTLTRLGGKKLDPDNLANCFKAVQDGVAAWLGVDDGDETKVRWKYRARPGYRMGCRIHIKERA